ncbi:5-carboxymethyl-2-hydroxymuconate Delta-isomerase [Parachitinimonas caeni]|uniref:5-carboxymethyl-2-hydroxymuconate Delta-isomerase n=1 Tax=Parachitinimonas caeni TaxID=3031301 RepID=A0ABT7DTB5_9NEIS|nr:5-carboxymethyl-2-hydroxymuconate Delta-isomerase [Parachitinimonas caeni]MDK2123298.1 5-carboxymethyl-2-hydroxymuconate Delta-isomerase [Parachitinimonas caeni]
MPHIVIDYSDNLAERPDFQALFAQLHAALHALGDVQLEEIRSRANRLLDWRVGDGDPNRAFIHVKLHLLDSRPLNFKRRAVAAVKPIVAAYFAATLAERACQICFEVVDIRADCYEKIVSH